VLEYKALEPIAVFLEPSSQTAPVPLLYRAESPMATRLVRSVFLFNALLPMATFEYPVVLEYSDLKPSAVL